MTFDDDSLPYASGGVQPSVSSRCRGFLPTPNNFQTKQNKDIKNLEVNEQGKVDFIIALLFSFIKIDLTIHILFCFL